MQLDRGTKAAVILRCALIYANRGAAADAVCIARHAAPFVDDIYVVMTLRVVTTIEDPRGIELYLQAALAQAVSSLNPDQRATYEAIFHSKPDLPVIRFNNHNG
jgi:hypothetical protein